MLGIRPKTSAKDIVDALFSGYIDGWLKLTISDKTGDMELEIQDELIRKYRAAITLMAVISKVERSPKFIAVQDELERRLFGEEINVEGVAFLDEIKQLMIDLDELLVPKEFSLSRFRDWANKNLEIDSNNVFTIYKIYDYFISGLSTVTETLDVVRV